VPGAVVQNFQVAGREDCQALLHQGNGIRHGRARLKGRTSVRA
jgi:hypothetical protein